MPQLKNNCMNSKSEQEFQRLKNHLNRLAEKFNNPQFIELDPISIPHQFKTKQDIEIAGLFAATLAWGQRVTIINNGNKLMQWMDNSPYDFILNHQETDLQRFLKFVHRTFNATDTLYFIHFLKMHYSKEDSLETAFTKSLPRHDLNIENALIGFHKYFFSLEEAPQRTRKHISTPLRKSACKRLCMFLRWMVRNDKKGIDFGLWKTILPSQLICPVDVHVDRVARELGLITRTQTDWQCALELTSKLKEFDSSDPVKYDFALFGESVSR